MQGNDDVILGKGSDCIVPIEWPAKVVGGRFPW